MHFSPTKNNILATPLHTLQSMRDDHSFDLFWQRVLLLAKESVVDDPELPRLSKEETSRYAIILQEWTFQ